MSEFCFYLFRGTKLILFEESTPSLSMVCDAIISCDGQTDHRLIASGVGACVVTDNQTPRMASASRCLTSERTHM